MRKKVRKMSVKTKRVIKYKKKIKKPEFKEKEDVIFRRVVESRKALEGVPKPKEPIKEQVEVVEEAKPEIEEEKEPIRLIVKNIPEHETFISKVKKKLKSLFGKKVNETWKGFDEKNMKGQ